MTLRVGESGKNILVVAGYDMSSYTELTLTFTKPDGTSVSKATADGVAIGAGETIDGVSYTANEYVYYPVEAAFLDTAGTWCVYITYTNTAATPDDVFIGEPVSFTVYGTSC